MKLVTLLSTFILLMLANCAPSVGGFSIPTPSNRPLSSSVLRMTVLTYGSKKKDFKPGTPLSKAVEQLGVKPRYSCKK
jgi:hypothetical protein